MDELKKDTITIKGVDSRFIESLNTRVYDVDTDKGKFQFWETKKDGGLTKASEQYQRFRFIAGDTVEVAYKESEASYTNSKTGATIHKVNKNIVYFAVSDENTPKTHNTPLPIEKPHHGAPAASQAISREEVDEILRQISDLGQRLSVIETKFEINVGEIPF